MIRKVLVKIIVLLCSAGAGLVTAVLVATSFIWYAYELANDGPIFPAPLVAIGLIALPYALLLFPLQIIVMLYEFFRKKMLGIELLIIGIIGGALAGLLWCFALKSSQLTTPMAILLIGIAILQAFVVFGLHMIANKLNIGNFNE